MMEHTGIGIARISDNICYYSQRVYYSDTDAGGIVYHSRYLDFTEHARTELLRTLGIDQSEALKEASQAFVVRSLSIDYAIPAILDDLLTIESQVLKCGRFSMLIEQRITRGDTTLAVQETKVGHVDLKTGRPLPVPERVRELFLMIKKS